MQFIMHDITYSQDSSDYIEVPMPEDEESFPLNTTLRVYRSMFFQYFIISFFCSVSGSVVL